MKEKWRSKNNYDDISLDHFLIHCLLKRKRLVGLFLNNLLLTDQSYVFFLIETMNERKGREMSSLTENGGYKRRFAHSPGQPLEEKFF